VFAICDPLGAAAAICPPVACPALCFVLACPPGGLPACGLPPVACLPRSLCLLITTNGLCTALVPVRLAHSRC
jgi:hypothetical protein